MLLIRLITAGTLMICICGQENDTMNIDQKYLKKPVDLELSFWPIGESLKPTSLAIHWTGHMKADRYIATMYIISNGTRNLYRKVDNLQEEKANFMDLFPDTKYEIYVTSVREEACDTEPTFSAPSKKLTVTTPEACPKYLIFSHCSGHCYPTCRNKYPICPKHCTPGCVCPSERPYRHGRRCVTRKQCKVLLKKKKHDGMNKNDEHE